MINYKDLIIYQIYPLSFFDSNDDGIGDLEGIISKVSYIRNLGANAIWLSPIYESPLEDNGYDISDYKKINPIFGDMETFKKLLKVFHDSGIKVIMDLVVNHTSKEHFWFQEALKGKDNKYHDYYIWKDKQPNWKSLFGGKAFEYVKELDEYYLHLFAKGQPDLNWENENVRAEIKSVLKFYLDMGVDGFRCDVINLISKTHGIPNGKPRFAVRGLEHYLNCPRIHEYLTELREDVINNYDAFLIGEGVFISPEQSIDFAKRKEVEMFFEFDHTNADCHLVKWFPKKFKLKNLKKELNKWQYALKDDGWNTLYFNNHDQPRSVERYGNLYFRESSAKFLATYLFCLKGTPFIYQGEEIGMTNAHFPELSQYEDIETKNVYKTAKKFMSYKHFMKIAMKVSRDNARTPMQWSNEKNAGFSNVKPWFRINRNYKEINVRTDLKKANSIYRYYERLTYLKKTSDVLKYGDYTDLVPKSNKEVKYLRKYKNEEILVVGNFRTKCSVINTLGYTNILLSNCENKADTFKPFEIRVYYKEG